MARPRLLSAFAFTVLMIAMLACNLISGAGPAPSNTPAASDTSAAPTEAASPPPSASAGEDVLPGNR